MSVTSPQPNPNQNEIIETIFNVVNMAMVALSFVPGIPPVALTVAHTAISDIEAAYAAYTANPTADLYDEIVKAVEAALTGMRSALHP